MAKILFSVVGMVFVFSSVIFCSETKAGKTVLESRTISIDSNNEITLVSVPAGSYEMGDHDGEDDEKPVHTVTLDAFEMSTTEITQSHYKALTGNNPSHFAGDGRLPVERVTWYDAAKFCNMLSVKEGLPACYNEETWECDFTKAGFRLPTEAEWEYACRAGTSTEYYTGDTESDLARAGWYGDDEGNSDERPHPVAQKEPNAWGLYDMHGNVWEWTNDFFGSYGSEPAHNPKGPESGSYSVMRGGSWLNRANYCRSYFRINDRSERTGYFTGFRIVRSIKP